MTESMSINRCWYRCMFLCLCLSFLGMAAGHTMSRNPNDFWVQNLQEIEPAFASFPGKMYAGLLPVSIAGGHHDTNKNEAEFMFWLFVPNQQSVPDTMTIWLNGGPYCSSILGGVLLENSPVTLGAHAPGTCCIDPNDPFQANPNYAWTVATTMLYVEQPTGTGFSNAGQEPDNEHDVGRDFYGFLQNFYTVFEDLQAHRLSMFGESYAGMFVPAIARRIALENEKTKNKYINHNNDDDEQQERVVINLDGIALGNGWMDATVQGPSLVEYAFWHGMIDAYTRDAFLEEWDHCYSAVRASRKGGGSWKYSKEQKEPTPFHPFTTPDECGIMEAVLAAAGAGVLPHGKSPNTYDVTTFDPYAVIGTKNSTFYRFMNNPKVKEALHAPQSIEWVGCRPGAGRRRRRRQLQKQSKMLEHDEPISVVPYVAELLDRWGVRVLIYNGDLDMSTNAGGSEMLLNSMKWSGQKAWAVAGRGIWMMKSDETVAGYVKKYANLSFLVVKNSGHLVPYNKPMLALDLIERFLQDAPFLDIPLPSFLLSPPPKAARTVEFKEQSIYDEEETVAPAFDENHSGFYWLLWHCVGAMVCFLAGFLASNAWRRTGYELVIDDYDAR